MDFLEENIIFNINSPEPIQGGSFKLNFTIIDGKRYILYEDFLAYQDWKAKTHVQY